MDSGTQADIHLNINYCNKMLSLFQINILHLVAVFGLGLSSSPQARELSSSSNEEKIVM